MLSPRSSFDEDVVLFDPTTEVNAGLWTLFAVTTVFLVARLWCKVNKRHELWWDDYILLFSWLIVIFNDVLITVQFATGYVTKKPWDDRMHILVNISACGTLVGQAISKTAFAVTLLRMTTRWQQWILWFIIVSMNTYMFVKVLFQWARHCDDTDYDVWYRPKYCVNSVFLKRFKQGGNVYNIIMDFVMALFPWAITSQLRMRRYEKLALALTMSLGVFVAIFSAVRTWWVGRDVYGDKDGLYFWRRAMSMIWFSAEITGTIIVQCIPVLRPFLREVHASFASRTQAHGFKNDTSKRPSGKYANFRSSDCTAVSGGRTVGATKLDSDEPALHLTSLEQPTQHSQGAIFTRRQSNAQGSPTSPVHLKLQLHKAGP